jgi:hypothetical protein
MVHFKLFTPLALIAGLVASIAAPAPLAAQQAYAYNTVFDDATGWTLAGLWSVDNTPAVANASPGTSGGNNLNFNNGNDYANANYLGDSAIGPNIDLTGVTGGTMSFWCRYQTEDTGTSYDRRYIRIRNTTNQALVYDQQFAQTAGAPLTCPSMLTWHQHTWSAIPPAALGIPIRIEFFFYPVDTVGNNYQGWFIDDFQMIVNDTIGPDAIADLAATNPQLSTVDLSWTAPADNDLSGKAQSFDLRYATAPITNDADFASATTVTGEPIPGDPGTPHTVTLSGLNPGVQYWFAIKSVDQASPTPNVSALSNVPTATTLTLPPVGGSATNAPKPPKDRYNACTAGTLAAPAGLAALAALVGLAAAFRALLKK